MDRTLKCLRFQIDQIKTSTIIFFSIFVSFYILLIALLYTTSSGDSSGSVNGNFAFAAVFFLFINTTVNYTAIYNNLLIFGNTRKNINISFLSSAAIISAIFAALSIILDVLNRAFLPLFGIESSDLISALFPYGSQIMLRFLWFFTVMLVVAGVALLFSALNYIFGKTFKRVFWTGFGLSWVFIPFLLRMNGFPVIVSAIEFLVGYGNRYGILLSSLNFFVIACIFGTGSFLLARRQPQKG